MPYILEMMEKDFDEEIHTLTGLIDKNQRPIVRTKYEDEKNYPLGFGRHNEWRTFDLAAVTSPDTSRPS